MKKILFSLLNAFRKRKIVEETPEEEYIPLPDTPDQEWAAGVIGGKIKLQKSNPEESFTDDEKRYLEITGSCPDCRLGELQYANEKQSQIVICAKCSSIFTIVSRKAEETSDKMLIVLSTKRH